MIVSHYTNVKLQKRISCFITLQFIGKIRTSKVIYLMLIASFKQKRPKLEPEFLES